MLRVLLLLSAMSASPALALEPQCRFPGPWSRSLAGVHSSSGGHISPLEIAADPTVIHDGPTYKMWFTNGDSVSRTGVAYAESPDGSAWTVWQKPQGHDPIMDLVVTSTPAAWDTLGVETPYVLRKPTGGYRLYYTGDRGPEGSMTYSIGAADSADGIAWTRVEKPVLEPSFDWEMPVCASPGDAQTCQRGGVLEPSVLYDQRAKLYRMWYVGLGEKKDSFRTYRIGYATSADGLAWTRNAEPVFDLGKGTSWDSMWTSHVEVVADPKAGFHMFYFGSALKDYREGVAIQRGSIGHAFSLDGITWERDPANPILAPRPGQADAWSVGGPSAIIENGKLRLWYYGTATGGLKSNIFTVEARCGS